ncbi:hypothetical protein PY365_04420 [Roseiarcaceae bacterium H3SJ34-1]|uniref:hypothetical protein n=1 Tax=Terripilifer ovatus TaxID=3032367 RepID=UPI003AB98162|nr:hypothetical protein [Roseiarcaceae bacterium H3SJ34-1]
MACKALQSKKCLELDYHGFRRVVEVHTVGRSSENTLILRAWQVRGGSLGGEPAGWKLMHLDEITNAHLTAERSMAPRPDYNPKDPAMAGGIICKV